MTDPKTKPDHRKEDKAEDAKKQQKVELNDLESTKDPKGGGWIPDPQDHTQ